MGRRKRYIPFCWDTMKIEDVKAAMVTLKELINKADELERHCETEAEKYEEFFWVFDQWTDCFITSEQERRAQALEEEKAVNYADH